MAVDTPISNTIDSFGCFHDEARERQFRMSHWDEDRRALYRVSWAAAILFLAGSSIDLATVGWGSPEFFFSFIIRLICAAAAIGLATTTGKSVDVFRTEKLTFSVIILLVTGYVAIANLAPDFVYIQSAIMLAVIIFPWFFVPIHPKYNFTASVVTILGYLLLHFRHAPEDQAALVSSIIIFSGVSVMGFLSARSIRRLKRSNCLQQLELTAANSELQHEVEIRKDAEVNEAAMRERFEGLFRASPMPLVLTNHSDGVIVSVNDACCSLLERKEEDILGREHGKFIELSDAYEELSRLVDMKPGTVSAELVINTGSGKTRECVVSTVRLGDDEQAMVLTGLYDITERKEFELDLIKARLDAEKAQSIQTDFLATMSHEIRTPLNALLGFLQVMEFDRPPEPARSNLSLARQSGEHLLRLITDILDLSKLSSGTIELEPNDVNCSTLCAEAMDTFALTAKEKDITANFQVDLPHLIYNFDELRVRQILFNLIGNAIKFTHTGGVSLRLQNVSAGPNKGDALRFEVHDTGIGIAPEKRAHIFKAFTQADTGVTREFGGTGLGLTISRRLITAMGGTIGTEANADGGSTFWFEIPAIAVADDEINHVLEKEPECGQLEFDSPTKILVAEDNPMNQRVIAAFLTNLGAECDIVADGREAVAALRVTEYSLVLMDIQMPVLDGLTAIRFIRSGATPNPQVPIVALTANAMAGDRERYLKAGADAYLAKPITLGSLRSVLQAFTNPPSAKAG